jgi:hypothetical protein
MYLLTDLDFPCPKVYVGTKEEIVLQIKRFIFDVENGILTYSPKFSKTKIIRHYKVNMPSDPFAYTSEELHEVMTNDAIDYLVRGRGWKLFHD